MRRGNRNFLVAVVVVAVFIGLLFLFPMESCSPKQTSVSEGLSGRIDRLPDVLLADTVFMNRVKAEVKKDLLADPAFLAAVCNSCQEQKRAATINPVVVPKIRPFKKKDDLGSAGYPAEEKSKERPLKKEPCEDSVGGCDKKEIEKAPVGQEFESAGYPNTKSGAVEGWPGVE